MLRSTVLFRQKFLVSVIAGACAASTYGQDAGEALEEIQITGSRIRNTTSMTTPTPVTAVTQAELVTLNPASTMAEQLDQLPQFFNTQTAQRGGGTLVSTASGSFLNLRGMGTQRTLVLLDGSRIVPADAGGAANIDNFPTALMSRVDVITGGASAAYGADALAGVVNFVLDREFEGLKTKVSTGVTERMDGENWNLSVAGGKSFMDDRLHLIGSFEARYIDQIVAERDRLDNWEDWGIVQNPAWVSATATPNVPRRLTVPYVFDNRFSPAGLITTPGFTFTNYTFTDDGKGVRPYVFGQYSNSFTSSQSGGPEYRNNTEAFFQGPDGNEVVQRSFFNAVKFDVTEALSLRAQAIVGRTEANAFGLRGNMSLGPTYDYIIFADNAYLPQVVRDEMIRTNRASIRVAKRGQIRVPGMLNAYDDRGNRDISQMQSVTLGFDWDLDDNWRLTGNYQVGKSKVQTSGLNFPRIDEFFLAVDAVRNASGQIVCKVSTVNPTAEQLKAFMAGKLLPSPLTPLGVPADSPVGPLDAAGCRTQNIFGIGNVSQEAIDYFTDEEKKSLREMDQDFAEILLSGDIYEGWGPGPIAMALGLTYRDEQVVQWTLPAFGERSVLNAPDLGIRGIPEGFAGPGSRTLHAFTGPPVGVGDANVKEVYGELQIPVWEWESGQRISTNLGYRKSDYRSSGIVDSWKIGLDVRLHEDLRWRFTKSRDVREPNLNERFFTTPGAGNILDPMFGGQPNTSLTILPTPSPGLQTEQGDTITTGFVYQPGFAEWVDGLQVALDWYEIDLDKSVGPYGGQRLVDDCYYLQYALACSLIRRHPTTGVVQQILNIQTNAGGAQTRGIDLEVQYSFEPDFFGSQQETFNMRAMVGYLAERSTTSAAGQYVDFVKRISTPEYTALATFNYNIGNYGIMFQTTYYDSTLSNGNNEGLAANWIEGVDIDDNTVASQTLFNMAFTYGREMASGGDWQVGFNINNLFDREPPIIATTTGQTLSNSHDQFGRRYQLSLNVNF